MSALDSPARTVEEPEEQTVGDLTVCSAARAEGGDQEFDRAGHATNWTLAPPSDIRVAWK